MSCRISGSVIPHARSIAASRPVGLDRLRQDRIPASLDSMKCSVPIARIAATMSCVSTPSSGELVPREREANAGVRPALHLPHVELEHLAEGMVDERPHEADGMDLLAQRVHLRGER